MFLQINTIFREKSTTEIANLKIPTNSPIIKNAQIDISNMKKDKNDNIIVNALQDKLDIIEAHFASINNRIFNNNRPQLNNIINIKVESLKN